MVTYSWRPDSARARISLLILEAHFAGGTASAVGRKKSPTWSRASSTSADSDGVARKDSMDDNGNKFPGVLANDHSLLKRGPDFISAIKTNRKADSLEETMPTECHCCCYCCLHATHSIECRNSRV